MNTKTPPKTHPRACGHGDHPVAPFDAEAAKGLSADEVRRRWPRVDDRCPVCGGMTIVYASFEHFLSGDW